MPGYLRREEGGKSPASGDAVLGLTPAMAVEMGLETETYQRAEALPTGLVRNLTPLERSWWEGTPTGEVNSKGRPIYRCVRAELNANDLSPAGRLRGPQTDRSRRSVMDRLRGWVRRNYLVRGGQSVNAA